MSRIAVVVKGYPRLSETFIAQEILGLEKRGINQLIVSLRHPTEKIVHDLNHEIKANVLYLPEYLQDDYRRVEQARRWAKSQTTFNSAEKIFKADLAKDKSPNRWRRWGQACVLANELPDDIKWIHTHYLHTPCSVARYASKLLNMNWSFSAHAKDIWTSPKWELQGKLADASWGVTCTKHNVSFLKKLANNPSKIELLYHGLDFSRFPNPPARKIEIHKPVRIISIGRAVEKKGYRDLLKALSQIKDDNRWSFDHIGGGKLTDQLKVQARKLGIEKRITWHGAKDREFVIKSLCEADVFVLPSIAAKSGDMDGLPNVIMEAQAVGLPIISTNISAIPEIVDNGENGILVNERNPKELAKALATLINDANLRIRLGENGAESVKKRFSCDPFLDTLAGKFKALEF